MTQSLDRAIPAKFPLVIFTSTLIWLVACNGGAYRTSTETSASSTPPTPPQFSVGYRIVDAVLDNKVFPIAVWYPANAPMSAPMNGSDKIEGIAAEHSPMKNGAFPLLVFSHGYSGGGIGQVALTAGLAARGWIVAAPDHVDAVRTVRIRGEVSGGLQDALNYLRYVKPFNRENYAYRPRELRATLDTLLALPDLAIDANHIALAGHSLGGWTAMTVASSDPRVKALVTYSMGELHYQSGTKYFQDSELNRLTQPVIYFYGSEEKKQNLRGAYARYCFDNSPAPAYLVEISGGNHFTYNDRAIAPRAGGSPEQIAHIVETTAAFLNRHVLQLPVPIEFTRAK